MPDESPKPNLADVAIAGARRYVPQRPSVDLTEFGGGKNERLSNAGKDADLIPDLKEFFGKDDLLTQEQAFQLYNDGITAEQFLGTPVGKKLAAYAQQDQDAFTVIALEKGDLTNPAVVLAFKRAQAAEYLQTWIEETLAKAFQAGQTLRILDEVDQDLQEGQPP